MKESGARIQEPGAMCADSGCFEVIGILLEIWNHKKHSSFATNY